MCVPPGSKLPREKLAPVVSSWSLGNLGFSKISREPFVYDEP